MLKINAMKQVVLFALIIFYVVLFSTIAGAAKAPDKGTYQEWAVIDGFRSAKFGYKEGDVLRAIKKDFKINKNAVSRGVNSNEKTVFLMIDVKDLLTGSGPSKVIYIFGYKSKKLIQVKVVWGKLAQKKPNIETIVSIATQLSNYFRQKRYQENGFASYRQLAEELILVFQGKDQKARATRLLLSNPKNRDGEAGKNISLTLSYIEKPEDPDVFKIKDGDF
jgi:hypothetical protein